jgi:tRNA pseudouridine55 synthase
VSQTPGSGLVVVDKPRGLTSHDVVARVRRLARTRRVGHAGTLDPMATGVLLLGVGRATRLLGHLALVDKSYDATVRLGASTTTDDAEGAVTAGAAAAGIDEATVRAAWEALVGEIEQVPSSVSAVKVGGRRAYERVRAGEDVALAPRRVTVHEVVVHRVVPVEQWLDVEVSVRCSTGTYVRALARDLGSGLGVGGHLTALRRTAVGPVTLADATSLADLQEAGSVTLTPMGEVAARLFPTWTVDEETARAAAYGRPLVLPPQAPVAGPRPLAVLGPDGSLLGLYTVAQGQARALAVLV